MKSIKKFQCIHCKQILQSITELSNPCPCHPLGKYLGTHQLLSSDFTDNPDELKTLLDSFPDIDTTI